MNHNRKTVKIIFLIFICILVSTDLLMSQISISISDSTVCYNYEFSLPVQISTAVNDTIIAYQLHFKYNSKYIEIFGASQDGAITEEWGEPVYNSLSGEFRVAGFSAESLFISAEDSVDTLLFINVRVVKNIIGTTNINIQKALFYDIHGQLDVEISSEFGAVLDIIHNESPYINNLEDIKFFEDSTYIFNIASYINDSDNTIDELNISMLNNEYFSYVYEDSNFTIIPEPNWSGVSSIILTVSDIYKYTDYDTVQVTVLPLEDDPMPFKLISPQDTTIHEGVKEIEFFWEKSDNVDKKDSITYTFYFGTDSTFKSEILREHESLTRESILLIISVEEGEYYWSVKAIDSHGNWIWCDDKFRKLIVQTTGIYSPEFSEVREFEIYQNYPNPFNSKTRIEYQLPRAINIKITIRDIRGRYIKTLLDDYMDSGYHSVVWNGLDNDNNPLSSGVYFICFKADSIIKMRKVVLVK